MKSPTLLTISLSIMALPTTAQITTDGTLGPSISLDGPNFQIRAQLGQQHGSNLFHSFRHFNLNSHESATFSGPNGVQNILSRVTGGNPSHIDGLIHSTIPNADMYFINPYGIMFGPNARLDVQGSFHASTADYLRLGDGGRFDARQPSESLLTVAPIEAFGFLSDSQESLSTEGSQLSLPAGKTFSLVGGDITIKSGQLFAPSGRLNLASVAQTGEVDTLNMSITSSFRQGTITLAEQTRLNVDGVGAGKIFIRGGQLLMQDSSLQANTLAEIDGKGIDLKLTESVSMSGDLVAISNTTVGSGNAGDTIITTPRLDITGSIIDASSLGAGSSGNIKVDTAVVLITEGGMIASNSFSSGKGGEISLNATDSLSILGQRTGDFVLNGLVFINYPSKVALDHYDTGQGGKIKISTNHLRMESGTLSVSSAGTESKAGDIIVQAIKMELTAGAVILSDNFVNGQSGRLKIFVEDTLYIAGHYPGSFVVPFPVGTAPNVVFENLQSMIGSQTVGTEAGGQIKLTVPTLIMEDGGKLSVNTFGEGEAGELILQVKNLTLSSGAQISSGSGFQAGAQIFVGSGKGGRLDITATGHILIEGWDEWHGIPSSINSDTLAAGQGGNILIQANHLTVDNGGIISTHSHNPFSNAGNAGHISISAKTIKLTHFGTINSESENAAGGNITITTPDLLYLRQAEISTSVKGGTGDGGNITIENPTFVVLDKGKIKAQADEGRGGNIRIVADQLIKSPDSLISASSRLGLDGNVQIKSPTVNLDDFLVVLPGGYIDASGQLPAPCTTARVAKNRFVVKHIAGSPPSPDDLQSNRLVLLPDEERATQKPSPRLTRASAGQSAPKVQTKSQTTPESRVIDEQLF
jgi:filamentous hemagglutinin family protein